MLSTRFGDDFPKATTTDVRWTILVWDRWMPVSHNLSASYPADSGCCTHRLNSPPWGYETPQVL
jgi:hypothetical protein